MHDDASRPPIAPRRPMRSVLHGVQREDDYAWLRDATAPESLAYLADERRYYDAQTAHSRALQDRLFSEMSGRVLPADSSVSWSRGGPVYYTRTLDGKEYAQFCSSDRDPAGQATGERVLLDLNVEASGLDYLELGVCEPSPDGRLLAWSADASGSEVFVLKVRDLETGTDQLVSERSYYTCAWSADSRQLLYTVPDGTNRPHQVWRHDLDADAGSDTLVLEEPDGRFELTTWASRSGEVVFLEARSRTTVETWWLPTAEPGREPSVVWPRRPGVDYEAEHAPGPDGGDLLLTTNDGAPEFRVVRVPLTGSNPEEAVEVLAGQPDIRWESADVVGGHAVAAGRREARPFLRLLDLATGSFHDVEAGIEAGNLALARNADPNATAVRVKVESLVDPPSWYDVDLASGDRTLVKATTVPEYDAASYVSHRLWALAPDGERIPVSLARHVDTPLDGTAPLLLWGYGSYESCDWPDFQAATLSLLDRGVVFAVAHVRGGGEMGRRWWELGHRATKHNTFSDYVAVADFLADGVVDGARIVSRGLSAGGLLQGVVLGLAPERWAAVIAEVPFVDCISSMLDTSVPLTVMEWDEWGDPSVPEEMAWLLAYSPYDNPPPGPRPALLVTGSLHDPRVLVHEPAKWVARLRATAPADQVEPLLFRVELGAGAHVGPAGRYGHLRYEAEVYAFALDALGGFAGE